MSDARATIVISDFHISNGAGYSWFQPSDQSDVCALLHQIANDPSVEELILLGDIFDLWLFPLDVVPWTVGEILAKYPEIARSLRTCVANIPRVLYINGNHDINVVASDLTPLRAGNNEMHLITPEWYSNEYRGVRRLEHGHAVDMFNAPDNSGDTIGGYPLGYFITRFVATADNQSLAWRLLKELLDHIGGTYQLLGRPAMRIALGQSAETGRMSLGSLLVSGITTLLKTLATVNDNTRIRFSEPDLDNKYAVADIATHYSTLLDRWLARYPDLAELKATMLAGYQANGLDWYARQLLSSTDPPAALVLGHTHHSASIGAYHNDGCWCSASALGHGDRLRSYVVIVRDAATLVRWE